MKSPFILFSLLLSSLSLLGNTYTTLSGLHDTISVPAEEAVLIVNATEDLVASIEKPSKSRLQVQFAQKHQFSPVVHHTKRSGKPQIINVSHKEPFVVAGPAKITLRTTGLLTMKREGGAPTRRFTSSSSGVRRFASR